MYPDYAHSIVNTTSSILKRYGCSCRYKPLALLDERLKTRHRNVVLMVFDGLGSDILERNLPADSFLRSRQCGSIPHLSLAFRAGFSVRAMTLILPSSIDPASYYLEYVPINLKITHLLFLNAGTLLITLAMLIIPSWYVSRISPGRALRFD